LPHHMSLLFPPRSFALSSFHVSLDACKSFECRFTKRQHKRHST
jgi:hypothetical protein